MIPGIQRTAVNNLCILKVCLWAHTVHYRAYSLLLSQSHVKVEVLILPSAAKDINTSVFSYVHEFASLRCVNLSSTPDISAKMSLSVGYLLVPPV